MYCRGIVTLWGEQSEQTTRPHLLGVRQRLHGRETESRNLPTVMLAIPEGELPTANNAAVDLLIRLPSRKNDLLGAPVGRHVQRSLHSCPRGGR